MRYEIRLHPDAFSDLRGVEGGLPLSLLNAVQAALLRLAEDPVGLSKKSIVPYKVAGQIYPFVASAGNVSHRLVAIFVYGEDEQTLHVLRVRHELTIM